MSSYSVRLNAREIAICRRLRSARSRLGVSQYDVARKLGITRVRLASYEGLRAPLPLEIAVLFCVDFNVTLEWLATGKGDFHGSHHLDLLRSCHWSQIPLRMPFGRAWERFASIPREIARAKISPAESRKLLVAMVEFWGKNLSDDEVALFTDFLWTFGEKWRHAGMSARYRVALQALRDESDTPAEHYFDSLRGVVEIVSRSSQLQGREPAS